MTTPRQSLRNSILRRHGVTRVGKGHLTEGPLVPPTDLDSKKTLAMKLIEQQHGKPIEELIDTRRDIQRVAKELGRPVSTISNWRLRLGLRTRVFESIRSSKYKSNGA